MWWTSHILQSTLGLSYSQLPLVLLEIWLDTYTLREVLLPSLGKGSIGHPPPRPPKMLLCEQGADRSSGPAGLSSPEEAFLNSVVSSCSSSSLRMKIPRVSLYSWVGKRGSVVDWWGNFHIGSCRDFSPRHQRGTHRVRRLEDMSEENTFSVKSPSMCQRLTFGTYPTFLEFTTVCLEKWCLFEDKE